MRSMTFLLFLSPFFFSPRLATSFRKRASEYPAGIIIVIVIIITRFIGRANDSCS
jgi:hypothetical protein